MRESSFPFLMFVVQDRSKHGLVRQYAAVPLTVCYLLHLVEEYPPHAWGWPSEHMDKRDDKEHSPCTWSAPHRNASPA